MVQDGSILMRYFDERTGRLIYTGQSATSDFWDDAWRATPLVRKQVLGARSTLLVRVIRRYLRPEDGVILEGGCGRGQHVAALVNGGYRCIGVDYAQQTVRELQDAVPELDIRWGDVRHLDFDDGCFAGYLSAGVIEHFWDGYEAIGREMARVIKPGGYLFVTFPHMSTLRKAKAALGSYPLWQGSQMPGSFYQFALDDGSVARDFGEWGFQLVGRRPLDGVKGVKDEITILKRPLQVLYDYRGRSLPIRGFRLVLWNVCALQAGHSVLLVFKRIAA